jgi:hypothetical protein
MGYVFAHKSTDQFGKVSAVGRFACSAIAFACSAIAFACLPAVPLRSTPALYASVLRYAH